MKLLLMSCLFLLSTYGLSIEQMGKKTMKIKISNQTQELILELEMNSTSKSLIEQLPLSIEIKDYASIEKIFYPPKKLSLKGAPNGYTPKKGDITYYSPWGDVAMFYKDFSHSDGLIYMGRIVSGSVDLDELKSGTYLISLLH
ncbi:cyclophilin-like fold protein [Halobacteriovorax sp. GB3]|uniref:cyclophilin-like fold protein n=1 Tax=Halobacteriovorax sp. GB3 TaxID=2719615 RepID=UPI002362F7B2|nr:cyclophilin-like fold protein [Halobacteriovorax sp. GB3]MDD0852145.1 cyclophilin-like fold protein [Halobacteriovorax sp. GB3]